MSLPLKTYPKKILAFDVETTGLEPGRDEIIQLAAIMVINGVKVDFVNLTCAPSPEALNRMYATRETPKPHPLIDKFKQEELKSLLPSIYLYRDFCNWLTKHIDKFDPQDKAWPLAYNGRFDLDFLSAFFKSHSDPYLGSWINWNLLDPLALVRAAEYQGKIGPLGSHKLEYVYKMLCPNASTLDAHDALSDIEAAYDIFKHVVSL